MPALNYQKQFADDVESGKKRQTVRAFRKDGRDPKPGQTLFHYTGMRTKACRKLREDVCLDVRQVTIENDQRVTVGAAALNWPEVKAFAKEDGFESTADFFDFFENTHGLPFNGLLIEW